MSTNNICDAILVKTKSYFIPSYLVVQNASLYFFYSVIAFMIDGAANGTKGKLKDL